MASNWKPTKSIQFWMDDVFDKQMDIASFLQGFEEERIRDVRYAEWDEESSDEDSSDEDGNDDYEFERWVISYL